MLCVVQHFKNPRKATAFNFFIDLEKELITVSKAKVVELGRRDIFATTSSDTSIITNVQRENLGRLRNVSVYNTLGIRNEHEYTMEYLANLHLFGKSAIGREGKDYFIMVGDSAPNRWKWDVTKMSDEFLGQVLMVQYYITREKIKGILS